MTKIMENSALIAILKTFSTEEIKEFGLYTESPFFNKNKNVIYLYALLKNMYPKFSVKNLEKENLFSKIFPGKKYNDENMKTLIYLLSRLAEKYMAFKKYNEEPYAERNYLLSTLDNRKLDKHFRKYEKRTEGELNNAGGIDLELINEKIHFGKIKSTFYSERNYDELIYR